MIKETQDIVSICHASDLANFSLSPHPDFVPASQSPKARAKRIKPKMIRPKETEASQ